MLALECCDEGGVVGVVNVDCLVRGRGGEEREGWVEGQVPATV